MSFVGQGITFPVNINPRGQFSVVTGTQNIDQSIYVILYTVPGERVMRPEFGCRIHELIFAPANDETAATAERYVWEALERWEPRIILHRVAVRLGRVDVGELVIEIDYETKNHHDLRSLVYPYYLSAS